MSTSILTGFDSNICSRCGKPAAGHSAVLLVGGETITNEGFDEEQYPDPVLHTMDWEEQHLICMACVHEILDDL